MARPLKINLVPTSLWNKNLAHVLPNWTEVRNNYIDTDEGCAREYLDKFGLSASELKVGDSKYDEAVRIHMRTNLKKQSHI